MNPRLSFGLVSVVDHSPPTASPAAAVPTARHVARSTLFDTNLVEPSHIAACTPVGCRRRAAMDASWSGSPTTRLTQGGLSLTVGVHDCSVRSGNGELGVRNVSKCEPPPHQPKPRRSPPLPCTVSETARVLLVPSVISAIRVLSLKGISLAS